MITSLLIDDTEYLNYIVDGEVNKLHIQSELDINSPISSVYQVTLTNESGLEDVLCNEDSYPDPDDVVVKLYNDGDKVFEGYLDLENSVIDPTTRNILLTFNGKEQKIADDLRGYDISQIYYIIEATYPVRQRGGRSAASLKTSLSLDPAEWNLVIFLVRAILEDVGITNHTISLWDESRLYNLYNQDKYGVINTQSSVGKLRNTASGHRGIIRDVYGKVVTDPITAEQNTDSYNYFLKKFAELCGAHYLYNYKDDYFYFVARSKMSQYLTAWTASSDDVLDDGNQKIVRRRKHDGVALKFSDMTFVWKIDDDGETVIFTNLSITVNRSIGLDKVEATFTPSGALPPGAIYQFDIGTVPIWNWGTLEPNKVLQLNNPLIIDIDESFQYYLPTTYVLDPQIRLTELMDMIYQHYAKDVHAIAEKTVTLNGLHFAPLLFDDNGTDYDVLDTETDFNEETTIIKFFPYVLPS